MRMGRRWRHIFPFTLAASCLALMRPAFADVQSATQEAKPAHSLQEQQKFCANIAASVEATRIAHEKKELSEMEGQLSARLAALEAKETELRAQLDRLDAFDRKANDALVAFYSGMKPDVAAAHLSELDDDAAAALLLHLKTKVSAAILNEMTATRGAALVKRIEQQRGSVDGKKP